MDKNSIKKYAVWARRELISRVSQKAQQFGITVKEIADAGADSVRGRLLSTEEKTQRQALIAQVRREGYEQVMEEVAYTWFNRFSALRFMEVNGYLPSHVRVFTDDENSFKPQILAEAIHLELDGLKMDKVYAFKEANDDEALFKYLLITQCNALSAILPGMFQRISDYTELLFPDNLLRSGSVLEQMISLIPEEDWKDQVQIIGWLYQYYNTEPKDKVFADLKKNIKITKENIPAATQLFTPDWIVRYMVENSLGRLWLEQLETQKVFDFNHIDFKNFSFGEDEKGSISQKQNELKAKWRYYIDEAKQDEDVAKQLYDLRMSNKNYDLTTYKCIDPCMGSGHILVYMFDVLMQIYSSCGYRDRDAVQSIIENNLYGLDIDDRAAQLAYFSVMMKARQYDARFFSRRLQPHVYAICESNCLSADMVNYFVGGDAKLKKEMDSLITEMRDAKEYGSILNITPVDFDALYARFDALSDEISMFSQPVFNDLLPFARVAQTLAQKYEIVVTNPPYMGSSGMDAKLGEYVKKNYPDSKSDLFAVFIERCGQMTEKNCYQAMITQHAWMFLSSFEKLREKLLQMDTGNMSHLGARAFDEIGGEVVQTTSFVMRKSHTAGYKGTYCRLIEPTTQQGKEDMFLAGENRYAAVQNSFSIIPGSPIAYWLSAAMLSTFKFPSLSTIGETREGVTTANNDRFLRLWFEVEFESIEFKCSSQKQAIDGERKWYPHHKGGEYRKWYGNCEYVINWLHGGSEIQNYKDEQTNRIRSHNYNIEYNFREYATWSRISSENVGLRYSPTGFIFDSASAGLFLPQKYLKYGMGLICSKIAKPLLFTLNPTIKIQPGDIADLPFAISDKHISQVNQIVASNISISLSDWDSFETSWDFKRHPLCGGTGIMAGTRNAAGQAQYLISSTFAAWESICNDRFNQLKANEEELNRIFIDIYGLADELTPEVEDKDVTVRKADLKRDVRSLISYAVGCMFGRYSLYNDGLLYAGGAGGDFGSLVERIQDSLHAHGKNRFPENEFYPDRDNIIPICDDEYFEDDITGRFVKFIETVYGKETLDKNLRFIADALGGSGQPKDVIRSYFLNDFYADHLKIYQKRPIYWLFDSGKKNGFKALIYMHRYAPDTLARMRTDYVHEQQVRYRTAMADVEHRIDSASASERVKLTKQLAKLSDQSDEIRAFEEKIHHLADQMIRIDLDDGVKHNYALFENVLAKIK